MLIPLGLPAILSAGILVLTRALEEFAIPGVLGAPSGIYTVTTYIYYQAVSYIPPRYEVAALLATALMAVTALCLVLQARLLGGGRRFTTVTGKAQPPRLVRLGRWRYVTLGYALAYIALTVVVPYLVLLYAAFITQWGRPPTPANLTLANVVATFDPDLPVRQGLANSLLLAVGGATAAALLTLIVGYIITSARPLVSHALDFVSAIPLAMPGPVMAVAVLWAYINPPFVLYGSLAILFVAYVTHYLPYGVRTVTGSFRQLSVEFERAAAACGAGRIAAFRDILFPLVRRGVFAGLAADVRVDDPRALLLDLPLRARQRNGLRHHAGDVAGGAVLQRRGARADRRRDRGGRGRAGAAACGERLFRRRMKGEFLYAAFMRRGAPPPRIHMGLRPHLQATAKRLRDEIRGRRRAPEPAGSASGSAPAESLELMMSVSILQPMSFFESFAARAAFRSADRATRVRPAAVPARSLSPSATLDLSKSRTYDAALEILGAYKLTGNFHVNLEIVLGALGARDEVAFEVQPATGLPYHPDCRHVDFRANANVPPDRFRDIVRSIEARLAFDAGH